MGTRTKALLHIKNSLSEYETGKLSLEGLQQNIEGELRALEGSDTPGLTQVLDNFVNQLELFIYSLPEEKRATKADEAIKALRINLEIYGN